MILKLTLNTKGRVGCCLLEVECSRGIKRLRKRGEQGVGEGGREVKLGCSCHAQLVKLIAAKTGHHHFKNRGAIFTEYFREGKLGEW